MLRYAWTRSSEGVYSVEGTGMFALVTLDGEIWHSCVSVFGDIVDRGEWDGREDALNNAERAMLRAVEVRRFLPPGLVPLCPTEVRRICWDDEDDGDE